MGKNCPRGEFSRRNEQKTAESEDYIPYYMPFGRKPFGRGTKEKKTSNRMQIHSYSSKSNEKT